MSNTDLMSDDEVEALTYQILKFFKDDPLTPDELTDQVHWAAQWANKSKYNIGLFKLVVAGEFAMGFDRETQEIKFRKLTPAEKGEPAPIADLDEDDEKEWWE